MKDKGHVVKESDDEDQIEYGINLFVVLSTYRVLIELDENYRLDLRDFDFRKLIGFDSKLVEETEYGTYLPDITRGVDFIHVNCDKVSDSIVDGQSSSTIAAIPADNLVRSLPFTYKPRFLAYNAVSGHFISSMRFYVTDSSGNPVDLNNIDWYTELFLRSMEI